jgi:Holliday junction DNA helicase RuvB
MILPDGKPLRINLHPFTLIGATTKPEWLTAPLKNRFVYKLHFMEYTAPEKERLLKNQLARMHIRIEPASLISTMCTYSTSVPREIGNLSKQLLDWLVAHFWCDDLCITPQRREIFWQDLQLQQWWLTPLHQAYLNLLEDADQRPLWIKTIATTLWIHERTIEEDIEPLLLKLKRIEKTSKWRILLEHSD